MKGGEAVSRTSLATTDKEHTTHKNQGGLPTLADLCQLERDDSLSRVCCRVFVKRGC